MAESIDDLEPLFDYRRVQPVNFVCDDDDDCDSVVSYRKRRKVSKPVVQIKDDDDDDLQVVEIAESTNKDEEDWLPPPPKVCDDVHKRLSEDSTIKELRLKKQELESLTKSAEVILRAVEESAKRNFSGLEHDSSMESVTEKPPKEACERAKIVISIQGKDEIKQYRVYKDDNFERLFKMYADKVKVAARNLVFVFDGEKINPTATPDSLGMEDDDIIEVHVRKAD